MSALNPTCRADLDRLAIEYDINLDELVSVGAEDDEFDKEDS